MALGTLKMEGGRVVLKRSPRKGAAGWHSVGQRPAPTGSKSVGEKEGKSRWEKEENKCIQFKIFKTTMIRGKMPLLSVHCM